MSTRRNDMRSLALLGWGQGAQAPKSCPAPKFLIGSIIRLAVVASQMTMGQAPQIFFLEPPLHASSVTPSNDDVTKLFSGVQAMILGLKRSHFYTAERRSPCHSTAFLFTTVDRELCGRNAKNHVTVNVTLLVVTSRKPAFSLYDVIGLLT